jgi:hypothetical protein
MSALGNEFGPLQDGHVLLDGGETHWVEACQLRDGIVALKRLLDDAPSCRVGEGVEHLVGPVPVSRIYNHMVVDYQSIARCQTHLVRQLWLRLAIVLVVVTTTMS